MSKKSRRPQPPGPLSDLAKKKWDSLADDLIGRDVWTDQDRHALWILADSLASYEYAVTAIARDGELVLSKGTTVKHPASQIKNQSWQRAEKLFNAFGLTPAGRKAIGQKEEGELDLASLLSPPTN